MKTLYWRPSRVSRIEMALLALVALACLLGVERFKIDRHQPYFREKMEAARFAETAFAIIKTERLKRGTTLDPDSDPASTGLIGTALSGVTSNHGDLEAKQTTVNPNFGAVLVQMLRTAGVGEGDTIAVGMSGSFPALNIAVLAASRALQLKPLIVVSAAASQWGANDPNFVWLDMQRTLREHGLFSYEPLAATRGGVDDRAVAMASEGRTLLDQAITRSGVPALQIHNAEESVGLRMALYRDTAGAAPIKAYINVGGGTTSVGSSAGKHAFHSGLNMHLPAGAPMVHSVMQMFANEGTPVIHLEGIKRLAEIYGLPIAPPTTPAVGEGGVYKLPAYNTKLAAAALVLIIACMVGFLRLDVAMRLLRRTP